MTASPLVIAAAALLTAALSGIAGIGGGTILIGIFYAAGLSTAEAVPLHALVQAASNGSRVVAYFRHVEWRATGWFLLGALPAPLLIAPWVAHADTHAIELVLALLIVGSLIPRKDGVKPMPLRAAYLLAGVLVGSVGMFVGASGLFVGKLFLRPEWRKETMIGTLALCQCLGHLSKIAGYASAGLDPLRQPQLLWPLLLAVVLGTVLGRALNKRLSEEHFRVLVNALLWIMSLKLLWDGARGLGWI